MPWLFYPVNTNNVILTDTAIATVFTRGQTFSVQLAKYSVEGHYEGTVSAASGEMMLCKMEEQLMASAFVFGKYFYHSVCALISTNCRIIFNINYVHIVM